MPCVPHQTLSYTYSAISRPAGLGPLLPRTLNRTHGRLNSDRPPLQLRHNCCCIPGPNCPSSSRSLVVLPFHCPCRTAFSGLPQPRSFGKGATRGWPYSPQSERVDLDVEFVWPRN